MAQRSYRRRLPHWREEGGTYFVTWRLERRQAPLTGPERGTVLAVIRTFAGARFDLLAAVVMDDHVHVLVRPAPGRRLERIVQGWKSASARLLAPGGRRGGCWQREYYDRLVRTEPALRSTLAYIRDNPIRRWPGIRTYPWLYLAPRALP